MAVSPVSGLTLQFLRNGTEVIGESNTSLSGDVSTSWIYPTVDAYGFPNSEAHTVMVRIKPGQDEAFRHMATQPVMLKVGAKTRLPMEVTRNYYSSTGYVIGGRLINEYGSGIPDRTIHIKVNGTEYTAETKWDEQIINRGYFLLFLDLQPKNNQRTVYNITALFEGDEAKNASAYHTLPNGKECAVCTTIQYFDAKPSCNSTWLTVEPQAAEAVTQTNEGFSARDFEKR